MLELLMILVGQLEASLCAVLVPLELSNDLVVLARKHLDSLFHFFLHIFARIYHDFSLELARLLEAALLNFSQLIHDLGLKLFLHVLLHC